MQREIYKKLRQEMQYVAGAEFNTKKKISHYVSDRTDDFNQRLEESQETYRK